MILSNLQVDVNPRGSNHVAVREWDSCEHNDQATGILADFIEKISRKFPLWSEEEKLKSLPEEQHYPSLCSQPVNVSSPEWFGTFTGMIAAYNMGDGSVHSYERVDENTTGRDNSNDVVARAQWFKHKLSFESPCILKVVGLTVCKAAGVLILGPAAATCLLAL